MVVQRANIKIKGHRIMLLPFLDPENDIYINLSIILIILNTLGETNRGVLKINNGKLHIFLYLIKNPIALNKFLDALGKDRAILSEQDIYSVSAISPNIETLFDRESLKALLSILISKNFIKVSYKNNGFFYSLTENGFLVTSKLKDDYLLEISLLCGKLKSVLSISESQLNQTLNNILRKESR